MQSFEIKRGHGSNLENGGLKSMMEEQFGEIEENENLFTASFKALKKIDVEFVSITEIRVETETDLSATPEDSLAAHQAYNKFMENATAFNAKQRVDRAKAKAKREAKAAAEKEIKNAKTSEPSTKSANDEESPENNENDEESPENNENDEEKKDNESNEESPENNENVEEKNDTESKGEDIS